MKADQAQTPSSQDLAEANEAIINLNNAQHDSDSDHDEEAGLKSKTQQIKKHSTDQPRRLLKLQNSDAQQPIANDGNRRRGMIELPPELNEETVLNDSQFSSQPVFRVC